MWAWWRDRNEKIDSNKAKFRRYFATLELYDKTTTNFLTLPFIFASLFSKFRLFSVCICKLIFQTFYFHFWTLEEIIFEHIKFYTRKNARLIKKEKQTNKYTFDKHTPSHSKKNLWTFFNVGNHFDAAIVGL